MVVGRHLTALVAEFYLDRTYLKAVHITPLAPLAALQLSAKQPGCLYLYLPVA